MKTEIYNLIILDESGSMACVAPQTISGCNETLNTIRSAQEQYADTQDHYVSIFAFQGGGMIPSRYLVKNVPAREVADINDELYLPCGNTPLYDAIGSTLADLKSLVKEKAMAIGNVTIITDGMENSSQHYDLRQVAKMISALKEEGWCFSFIGANIDVKAVASDLGIDNALEFRQDDRGTREMFEHERRGRMGWYGRTDEALCCISPDGCATAEEETEVRKKFKKASKGYFGL